MYDAPIASANTFNKVNVCLGLEISGYQPQLLVMAPMILTRREGLSVQHTSQ